MTEFGYQQLIAMSRRTIVLATRLEISGLHRVSCGLAIHPRGYYGGSAWSRRGASVSLTRLIAEAEVLAGGEHQCHALGHVWVSTGGRACPRGPEHGGGPRSQAVYECTSCGLEDYGEPGGPGFRDCYTNGPCVPGCSEESI